MDPRVGITPHHELLKQGVFAYKVFLDVAPDDLEQRGSAVVGKVAFDTFVEGVEALFDLWGW